MLSSLGFVSAFPAGTPTAVRRPSRLEEWWRLGMWMALYAIAAVAVTRPVLDWDIWWHLRTGQWIVEHGAVPETDPFSGYTAGRPWVAYSWLFEVIVYLLHRAFGLHGIILYRAVMSFAVVASAHRFVAKRQPRFLPALGLVGTALIALVPVLNERPWLFTILFTTWTLGAVLDLREGRAGRLVWLLPVAYVVWANVHIQFVYGLLVLGLACAAPLLDHLLRRDEGGEHAARFGTSDWRRLAGLTCACGLATLVNPFGARLYAVVGEYAMQPGPYRLIYELTSLAFRDLWDWAVLGLVLAAAFILGRRARVPAFEVLLLGAAAYFSFRAKRDIWFTTLAALAVLTTPRRAAADARQVFWLTPRRLAALAASVMVVLGITAWVRELTPAGLEKAVAEKFPARAAEVVRERGYAGPVYNHFNWGGYLIWALPELPAGLDGRTNLHGDERIVRIERTWAGRKGWEDDPDLAEANVVIADTTAALTGLLRRDDRFETVYENAVAVVFVRR
jgi:hypothetical protein